MTPLAALAIIRRQGDFRNGVVAPSGADEGEYQIDQVFKVVEKALRQKEVLDQTVSNPKNQDQPAVVGAALIGAAFVLALMFDYAPGGKMTTFLVGLSALVSFVVGIGSSIYWMVRKFVNWSWS